MFSIFCHSIWFFFDFGWCFPSSPPLASTVNSGRFVWWYYMERKNHNHTYTFISYKFQCAMVFLRHITECFIIAISHTISFNSEKARLYSRLLKTRSLWYSQNWYSIGLQATHLWRQFRFNLSAMDVCVCELIAIVQLLFSHLLGSQVAVAGTCVAYAHILLCH